MTRDEATMSRDGNESRTSGGIPIPDELVQRLADDAEAGYDMAGVRRRGGRRPLGSAPAEVVPVRLDPELRAALTARAQAEHTTASDVIRQALHAWLNADSPMTRRRHPEGHLRDTP
jgi:hypothetical protein